jgi:uncharacterized membrane protein YhaH (DUF805 family)
VTRENVLDPVEVVGYVASALVVVSLMMSSLLRLRLVSLVGSLVFATYGLLIGSLPVVLTNLAILVINISHLARLWRDRARDAYFEVVDVEPSSHVLQRFVAFHHTDIRRFQPEFAGLRPDHLAWMVLRDGVPVGAVLATPAGDGAADLDLDYVTEAHRDFSPGSALFGHPGVFERRGVGRARSLATTAAHRRYLKKMGFHPEGDRWVREVG